MAAIPVKPVEAQFEAMQVSDLDDVLAIEQVAYPHPWTRGNFIDTLAAGYHARVLRAGDRVLGYLVAMKGVDEVHLLNITVAPDLQKQGWGRVLLDGLHLWARAEQAQWVWLEARTSNRHAQQVYGHCGYRQVGVRRGYYPAGAGTREDAVVMSLKL